MVGVNRRILHHPQKARTNRRNENILGRNLPQRPGRRLVHRKEKDLDDPANLNDNWEAFSEAMEDRFTDRQETGKDHEKLLALEYGGDIQTFLAKIQRTQQPSTTFPDRH